MRTPAPRRRLGRAATVAIATAVMAVTVPMLPAAGPEPAAAQQSGSAATRQVDFNDGAVGQVTVSKTEDLRNEVVRIEWSGFLPSTGLEGQTWDTGPNRANLHFPVVVFQCHHAEGGAPVRERCMVTQRTIRPQLDLAEEAAAPEPLSLNLPFVDVNGRSYAGALDSELPDDWYTYGEASRMTMTAANGTGALDYQIRTGDESPLSLGCGRSPAEGEPETACSLVVVPVRKMDCDPSASARERLLCIENPKNTNLAKSRNLDVALSESNWRNRVVFPLAFAPEEGHCELNNEERLPTMGSELSAEALYSWIPALCQGEAAMPVSYTPSGETLARSQYTGGGQDFVLGSRPVQGADRPTVHAPMAVSGFGVAFMLDDAENTQVTELRLNARLVAKLLTQSYRGSFCAAGDQELCDFLPDQPQNLLTDPEFQSLNPHLDLKASYSIDANNDDGDPMATLVLPSGIGDIPEAVTRWLLADADAKAFLTGAPDPWGTKVNLAFLDWAVPVDGFEWRDNWRVAPDDPDIQPYEPLGRNCNGLYEQYGSCPFVGEVLHDRLAQSITSLREIGGRAIVNAHPLQTTVKQLVGTTVSLQRSKPQDIGMRNIIGLVDLATAERYRLPVADLSTGGHDSAGDPLFAAPTAQNMFRALQNGDLDDTTGTIQVDYTEIAENGGYPGTMLVYGAGPTDGLDEDTAADYADLIEYAAGPGQVYGLEQGWLPPGYLALPPELAQQALAAANAIRDQTGDDVVLPPIDDPGGLTPPPGVDGADPPGGSGGNGTNPTGTATTDPGADPSVDPGAGPPAALDGDDAELAATVAAQAGWATWALPVALAAGVMAFGLAAASGAVGADPNSRAGRLIRWIGRPFKRMLAPAFALLRSRRAA